jgi:putative sugar O-methyltransferase
MIEKLLKVARDPGYAIYVFFTRYMRFNFSKKIFTHASEFRSDSENGAYAAGIAAAVRNQKTFDNFKRMYSYRRILEHVSREQGEQYLAILSSRNDGVLERAIPGLLVSDRVGNPIKYEYVGMPVPLSPTTLRYLKVASDLRVMFGGELGEVAEIGCGYGGQALVNDQLCSVACSTLFDLPVVTQLIEKYLDTHLLRGSYRTAVINQERGQDYDLVISNYAFSELPSELQLTYIRKVLSRAKRGYLTMNSGLGGPRAHGKLSLDELRELLPEFSLFEEEPLTHEYNYIIAWGFDPESVEKHFRVRLQ